MKRYFRLAALLLAAAAALSLTACGKPDKKPDAPSEPDEPEVRDTVVIAAANEPPTLHPYEHNSADAEYMNALTYMTLYRLNTDTLAPEPYLAESCEAAGETEWKLTIKSGVTFHDGQPVTAADVKASMEWAKSDYKPMTAGYTSWWSDVEVVDDTTLVINTNNVYSKALIDLTKIKVVPKSLIDSGNDFNRNPVGCGPYKLVSYKLGERLDFEAFDGYFEGQPAIKNLSWRIIPGSGDRTEAMENGEADFLLNVGYDSLETLNQQENITVIEKTGVNMAFMALNNEKAPFDNQNFRKAVGCAVDREAIVSDILGGAGAPAFSQTPAVLSGHSDEGALKYDLDEARRYLELSGVDPEAVSFTCICSSEEQLAMAEAIKDDLKEIGIDMAVEQLDISACASAVASGGFEAAIGERAEADIMSFIGGMYHSRAIGGLNACRVRDDETDRLYDLAAMQLDDAERQATLGQCSARVNDISPLVPICQLNVVRAADKNLQGLKISPAGGIYWQYVSWAE